MQYYSHSLAIVGPELRFSQHFEPNFSTVASSSVFHKIGRHDSPGLIAESDQQLKQECAYIHINYFAAALVHVTQYLNGWGKQMLLRFFFFKIEKWRVCIHCIYLTFYSVLFDFVVVVVIKRKKKDVFELLIYKGVGVTTQPVTRRFPQSRSLVTHALKYYLILPSLSMSSGHAHFLDRKSFSSPEPLG